MSSNISSQDDSLVKEAALLRACQPLADRLLAEGVTIELSEKDRALLLSFEKLTLAGYSEREWSYLRVASGIKIKAVAVLHSCLARYQLSLQKDLQS